MKKVISKNDTVNSSFSRAALLAEPSLIAVACYLARAAVEEDLKTIALEAQKSYAASLPKGGPT